MYFVDDELKRKEEGNLWPHNFRITANMINN